MTADFSWPAGAATGVGSLPGTDPHEAARMVLGELPELAFLAELPGRGPHADLAGRGAALLAGLHVDLQPSGWRLTDHPGRDARLARDLLARDLDALQEAALEAPPALLKVQATGPWTLAALLHLGRGERALVDHGAVADLSQSLAEGLRLHLSDLTSRLPATRILLQLDEPSLPAVLAGEIPTSSGWSRLRVPERAVVRERLRTVLPERAVVHCCAADPPLALLLEAGAGALSVDLTRLARHHDEDLGAAVEAGVGLFLGVVPVAAPVDLDAAHLAVSRRWSGLGFPPGDLATAVVVTPTCGLAGIRPGDDRHVLAACRELGRRLREAPG